MWFLVFALFLLPVVYAAQVPAFVPPSLGPTVPSSNYVGQSNGSLPKPAIVSGLIFDRFIQIWMENTDFKTANSNPVFEALTKEGILFDSYFAVTHPSEPNYLASVGGDFWGLADDALYNIPSNISTIVDLLEAKNISWASYQESMPTDGFDSFNFTSTDYVTPGGANYTYYVRKHNPLIIYDSVADVPARKALHRNFNDFAADVNASTIPQWVWITPNLVNDGHDTDITFGGDWLKYFLVPLLNDTRFNDNRTLILLTCDENETAGINNEVFSLLLGGAIPQNKRGTNDSTYYTHYSSLSTVQANWKLGSLGRGDTNKVMSNVFSLVANTTGYQNNNLSGSAIPLTNSSGKTPGPLNRNMYIPFVAPNVTAVGAGGGDVFLAPGLNANLTAANAPLPVNLTAANETVPVSGPDTDVSSATAPAASSSSHSASSARKDVLQGGVAVLSNVASVLVGGAMVFI